MTAHKDGSLEDELKAKLHETFPGPGVPLPEGHHDDEADIPLCHRRPVTDKAVFGITGIIVVAIVAWGLLSPTSFQPTMSAILSWVVTNLGWLFIISSTCFVLFAVWLALSRYGRIPLGADDDKPEFNTVSWIAMMFSAGMGIGLIFWGVTEPLTHFVNPPPGLADSKAGTALATALFHWGFHPWSMYAVVGLSIAYGSYRMGRRQLISSAFIPLLGYKRVEGPIGKVIDILAIFATMFGTAASLGLGALQIGSGIEVLGWVGKAGTLLLVAVVAVLTLAFVASAVSGVSRGIQWLSNINMVLALILAVFVFVAGPTVFILDLLPTALGDYAANLAAMSARSAAAGPETGDWLSSWTIFYWAWWISWTPFVGMFLARISRGRSIRQFVVGVILVPTTVSLIWFVVFGGAGIGQQRDGIDLYGSGEPESTLFGMLDRLPLAGLSSLLVMLLVAIFFVSGADAASMVMGTLSQRGSLFPSRWAVAFWGLSTGAVAVLMLWVGGNDALGGLQTMTIIVAAPFVIVMIGMCVSLYLDVSRDPMVAHLRRKAPDRHRGGEDEPVLAGEVLAHGNGEGQDVRT